MLYESIALPTELRRHDQPELTRVRTAGSRKIAGVSTGPKRRETTPGPPSAPAGVSASGRHRSRIAAPFHAASQEFTSAKVQATVATIVDGELLSLTEIRSLESAFMAAKLRRCIANSDVTFT